jgi:hypothetical protein
MRIINKEERKAKAAKTRSTETNRRARRLDFPT